MTRLSKTLPAAIVAALLTVTVAEAHHSFAMFDRDTQMVKTGTVQRWAFNNPHSWLYLNIKNEDGSETLWSFEGSAPTGLIGWAKLEDGKYLNPADGGCDGGAENQKKWEGWLDKGIKSSKDAEKAGL